MASSSRRTTTDIATQLYQQPYRFDFFQAVRLLEWMNHEDSQGNITHYRYPVGHDRSHQKEVVYFRALPSLQFPTSQINKLVRQTANEGVALPPEMLVTFMGLTGPAGVMPVHYTRDLLQRIHAKDYAMQDFYDLFNHRTISFYYRAWEKYRFYLGYERARREKTADDHFTLGLRSLVGIGSPALKNKTTLNDDSILFYAGLFNQHPRSAKNLQQILTDHFKVPVKIKQFISRRMPIAESEQTRLPSITQEQGQYCRLSMDAVLGSRARNSQGHFRLMVGPLNAEQFKRFLPKGNALQPIKDLTQLFAGTEFSFDVQLILDPEHNMGTKLQAANDKEPSRLGWNTWLGPKASGHLLNDLILG